MTITCARMYAVTTHVISSSVAPRFPDMSGSATLTMLESSTAMIVAVEHGAGDDPLVRRHLHGVVAHDARPKVERRVVTGFGARCLRGRRLATSMSTARVDQPLAVDRQPRHRLGVALPRELREHADERDARRDLGVRVAAKFARCAALRR